MPGPNANKSGSRGGSSNSGNRGGNKAPTSSNRPKEKPGGAMTKNASGAKTYRDTKTGASSPAPKFGGASIKGLTSKDPGNVARNRAGAARYATMSERMAASNRDTNADKAAAMAAARAVRPAAPAPVMASKVAPTTAAPKPGMATTRAPAGYRPGIDPEFNYRTGVAGTPTVARVAPTVTLAKGGKAPRKKK